MNQWKYFLEFLKNRKVNFVEYPVFYIYLIVIVIGFGGFGIWATIFLDYRSIDFGQNLKVSLMGFSIPIIASFAVDVFNLDEEENFINNIFRILILASSVGLTVLFIVFFKNNWSYLIASLSVISSIFFWWILNYNNDNLRDKSFYQREQERANKLVNGI